MKLIKKEVGKYTYGITDYGFCGHVVYEHKIILWKTLRHYYVVRKQGQYYLAEDNGWITPAIFKTYEEAEKALEEAMAYGLKEPSDPYFKFTPIQ